MSKTAICLNLDKRIGEQERIRVDFKSKLNIDVEFFVAGDGHTLPAEKYDHIDIVPPSGRSGYPAWVSRPNSYNAFLCFKKIIHKAKDWDLSSVLILEDDVVLTDNATEILANTSLQIRTLDYWWDILYFGINNSGGKNQLIAPNLLKVNSGGCFHAVCLRETVFDDILNLPMEGPIDGMVEKYLHKTKKCYACYPNIALTKPGFSFCEGREVDYNEMLLKEVK